MATFRHGDPVMVDHTPSGADVAAGDVLVIGDSVRIAHRDIVDGQLGALAIGGGVYDIAKATGVGTAVTAGTTLYWDDTEDRGDADGTGRVAFGLVVEDAGDDDATVRVYHRSN